MLFLASKLFNAKTTGNFKILEIVGFFKITRNMLGKNFEQYNWNKQLVYCIDLKLKAV